jgi:hypothetical protein
MDSFGGPSLLLIGRQERIPHARSLSVARSGPSTGLQHDTSSNERRTALPERHTDTMKYISELEPVTAQSRPSAKLTAGAARPRPRPVRRNEHSEFPRPQAKNAQSAEKNYERYLALARAEALRGDRIAAENYFQHAEHYFRSMSQNAN